MRLNISLGFKVKYLWSMLYTESVQPDLDLANKKGQDPDTGDQKLTPKQNYSYVGG
jgi:hypothetical protein